MRPAEPPVDEARVSELAGLLGTAAADPRIRDDDRPAFARPGYARATFPKAAWTSSAVDDKDDESDSAASSASSAAPSPFTAALARMVAGDRDVRQAVEEAVEEAKDQPAAGASAQGQ